MSETRNNFHVLGGNSPLYLDSTETQPMHIGCTMAQSHPKKRCTESNKATVSIYQLLLRYYLSSEIYYDNLKQLFLDIYNFCGECSESALPYLYGKEVNRYRFYTETYMNTERIPSEEVEYKILTRMTDDKIQFYFTRIQDEKQLFAVIFGYANDLSDKQISQISDLRHRRQCWDILFFFLLNRDAQKYSPDVPLRQIPALVSINGQETEAMLAGNTLTLCESGQILKVL